MIESGIVKSSQRFSQLPSELASSCWYGKTSFTQISSQVHAFRNLANQKKSPALPVFSYRQEFRTTYSLMAHGPQHECFPAGLGVPAKPGPGVRKTVSPGQPVFPF
jgi:hypothetical protein